MKSGGRIMRGLCSFSLASGVMSCVSCVTMPPTTRHTLPFKTRLSPKEQVDHLRWSDQDAATVEDAAKLIEARRETIQDLLAPEADPYRGTDFLPTECRPENLPTTRENGTLISFYSSKNFVLGLCNPAAERMKTQYLLLYCESTHKLFSIQYFYDASTPWHLSPIATCR